MLRLTLTALGCAALFGAGAFAPAFAEEGHGEEHAATEEHGEEHGEGHAATEEHGEEHAAHGEEHDAHGEEEQSDHVSEGAGVRVVHGWTRATRGDTALIFAEIENRSEGEVLLTGAETAIAESAQLVGFQVKDGALSYAPLPAVPLAAGREMELAPNGLAIRLNDLSRRLAEGDTVDVTLTFDTGAVAVHVAVESANATQHGHAGHQH